MVSVSWYKALKTGGTTPFHTSPHYGFCSIARVTKSLKIIVSHPIVICDSMVGTYVSMYALTFTILF